MSSEAPRVTDRSFLSSPIMGAAISSSSCCSLRSSLVPFGDLFGTGCGRSEAVLQTAVSHVPPLHAHAAVLRLPSSFSAVLPGTGRGFEHLPAAAARLRASIGRSGSEAAPHLLPVVVAGKSAFNPFVSALDPVGSRSVTSSVPHGWLAGPLPAGPVAPSTVVAGAALLLAPPAACGLSRSRFGAVVAFDGSPSRGMLK